MLLYVVVGTYLLQTNIYAANPVALMRDRYYQWQADRYFRTLNRVYKRNVQDFESILLNYVSQFEDMESMLRPDQEAQLKNWQQLVGQEYRKMANEYLSEIAVKYTDMQEKIREINPPDFYDVPFLDMEISGAAYIDLLHEINSQTISDYLSSLYKIEKYLSPYQKGQVDRWKVILNSMKKIKRSN